MGERKGTNLYYPPDYDPRKGGLNKFLGTHPLRERARKIGMGILIIRFEMPFNIWCNGCGNHIGMGVRYNAEKKKIGNYLTTPIWLFRMKCHLCTNYIEIKTEPKTCEYIIVSGARRQENRWDPKENEQVVPEEKETSRRLQDDSMFKLEHGYGDKKGAESSQTRLSKLSERQEKLWHDDYAANSALRQQFRRANQQSEPILLSEGEKKDLAVLTQSSKDTEKKFSAKKQKICNPAELTTLYSKNRKDVIHKQLIKDIHSRHTVKHKAIFKDIRRKSNAEITKSPKTISSLSEEISANSSDVGKCVSEATSCLTDKDDINFGTCSKTEIIISKNTTTYLEDNNVDTTSFNIVRTV